MENLRSRLAFLAKNLCWSWNHELDRVFRTIDVDLWRRVNHNPIAFLQDVDPALLSALESDATLIAEVVRIERWLTEYSAAGNHWASYNAPGLSAGPVAYFSPESAIHASLPIYSGGLGVLAGDHLKSCSDLGIPTFGITLLYRQGYFTQQIDAQGRQIEVYHDLDTSRIALERARRPHDGSALSITVPFGEEVSTVDVWQADVGRCKLVLLDANYAPLAEAGSPRLYGGDRKTRIVQEIVLGIGGYCALRAMNMSPSVLHLNEGHSAFAVLEAIAHRMEQTGLPFDRVSEEVADSVVFTTHTPVEAGHDRFDPNVVLSLLEPLRRRLSLSERDFLGLGRVNPDDPREAFCMTVLALKLSHHANAVSSLHGLVSRQMWRGLWPERRTKEVPIGHVTNGTHVDTWLATELAELYSDCLGVNFRLHLTDPRRWDLIENLDELALWSIKLALKRRLFEFLLRRLESRRVRLDLSEPLPELRTDVLTIGFARRFAAYKRASMLFEDLDRAKRILTNPERPVQIIFAGKAHPADEHGKALLQKLHAISRDPELRNHVVIVEDHDMNVSRHLLEGCDLWLNAPRRPLEACGTSGMKAVFNATLNCSTLDGWWDEAYDTRNGFAFGGGLVNVNHDVQDQRDAQGLLEVVETRVVPTFYDRSETGVPTAWLKMVKRALRTLAWRYNADRMVMDYVRRMYLSASKTLTAESRGP